MAKKRRRRPTAGPPPIKNPRYDAKLDEDGLPVEQERKLPPGAPVPPTFRSVVIRSVMASAVFFLVLAFTGGSAASNLVFVVVMFLILLGFGYVFDKWFYRWRLRRWERRRAGG